MLAELTLSMSCFHSWEWLQIALKMSVYLTSYKQAKHVGSLSLNLHQENLQHHESEKKFTWLLKEHHHSVNYLNTEKPINLICIVPLTACLLITRSLIHCSHKYNFSIDWHICDLPAGIPMSFKTVTMILKVLPHAADIYLGQHLHVAGHSFSLYRPTLSW